MEQFEKERLCAAGIDVDAALERFLGNGALLGRFLGKFPQDRNFTKLQEALAAEDWPAALEASHTLKGMCGNLSMTALFGLFTRQVEALRAGDTREAARLMEEIAPAYGRAVEAIAGLEAHGG